ncbi:hypothetical protein E2A64_10460 [Pseudohoeflea suaedae]|uniref:Uncharacterized protein n=1 Tax=Pseudohoeflea suaedae TaxID=877384 RepID=A0A4R5PJB1_9HYPH|nr:hypothetical protein [Pseudohoeflea suaedae]TDH35747.1 hypothetical protein E2A64_10460 [Pseudohoeflea suaedae]
MFEIFIDGPARLVAALIYFGWMIITVIAGVAAGMWVAGRLRDRMTRILANALGVLVFFYASLVLYRAQHWLAFELLQGQQ